MTLKEILKHEKLYVAKWVDVTEHVFRKITVFDIKTRKPLIRVLYSGRETKIYFGTKEQNLARDIKNTIMDEIEELYTAQRREKKSKKQKAFEQRKNAVYKEFLKQIQK